MAIIMCFSLLPVGAMAEEPTIVASGYCGGEGDGTNLSWTLDSEGTLRIAGTGAMYNYTNASKAPWRQYYETTKFAVIGSGVTSIGSDAFYGCSGLKSVTIGSGVTSIGSGAFYGCSSLTLVKFEGGTPEVDVVLSGLFDGCSPSLKILAPFGDPTWEDDNGYGVKFWFGYPVEFYDNGTCDHDYSAVITDPTCLSNGYTTHGCSKCGFSYVDAYTAALGHNYLNGVCTRCGNAYIDADIIDSGSCGDNSNVRWIFDSKGTLTISGEGRMRGYGSTDPRPFADYDVKSVVVESGVTALGIFAFSGMETIEHVYISDTVVTLIQAFYQCTGLKDFEVDKNSRYYCAVDGVLFSKDMSALVYFPAARGGNYTIPTVESIANYAFCVCPYLESLIVPASVKSIGIMNFDNSENLHSIKFIGDAPSIDTGGFYGCAPDFKILAPRGNTTWTNTGNYNPLSHTWLDYPIEFYGACEHSYTPVVIAPSCTERGYTVYTCSKCGDSYKDAYTEALPHSYKSVVTPPTCTEQGYTTYSCSKCGDSYKGDYVAALGGSHSYTVVTKEVTCTEQGYTKHTCAKCGYSYTDSIVPALQHDYVYVRTTAPTCTKEGFSFYTCSRCEYGDMLTDYVPALGHQFENGKCTRCGKNEYSGYCGGDTSYDVEFQPFSFKNLKWVLSPDGVLTVSGTGRMQDYMFDYPWDNCRDKIKSIVICSGVTSIGCGAFDNCPELESVSIANTVKEIGIYAFKYCSKLHAVDIPSSVETIGCAAFQYCTTLSEVTFHNGLKEIGERAFEDCSELWGVSLPDSLETIWLDSFSRSEKIKLLIPAAVEKIYGYTVSSDLYGFNSSVFSEFTVSPDNKYYSAENGVLFNKDKTELIACMENLSGEYTVPSTVRRICDWAFVSQGISKITIPDSVQEIGCYAFSRCYSLADVIISDRVLNSIDVYSAFYDTSWYKRLAEQCVWDLNENGVLTISGSGKMFARRNYSAPWDNVRSNIKVVIINKGITSIGAYAFSGCENLEYVSIPDTVLRIEDFAFSNCTALKEIVIPNGVEYVGDYAFYCCEALESAVLGDSIRSFGESVFCDCSSLSAVDLPSAITEISYAMFQNCSSLKSITIPEGVRAINSYAFQYTDLKKVIIPDGVLTIGDRAFGWLDDAEIYIPKSVRSLEDLFTYGSKITIKIADDNPYYTVQNNVVYTKDMTSAVSCPSFINGFVLADGVKRIGTFALDVASVSDKSIIIPEGIEELDFGAFYAISASNSLESVTFPKTIKRIDAGAFYYCMNLKSAKFLGDAPTEIGYDTEAFPYYTYEPDQIFAGYAPDFTIYAPAGNTTWTSTGYYNADDQTWSGYPIEFYEPENTAEGTVGDLTWTLDNEGTLTIKGNGRMGNYTVGNAPWKQYVREIIKVVIGEGVTDICFEAFGDCINLKYLTVEGKNQQFSDDGDVIYNKNKNELLYCPKGKTGEYSVYGGVKIIKASAFEGCTKLTKITINNSITTIEDRAFYGCTSLKEAYFVDRQPQSFGRNVFDNCAPDFTITAVNSNGKWTQGSAYNAKNGTWNGYPVQFVGKTVKDHGTGWTLDSNGTLEVTNTSGSIKDQAADVKNIVIAEGTTSIPEGMFDGCENLESVELPESVTEIGGNAFKDCENLSAIELSGNVEDIDPSAFDGCKALTEINVADSNPNYSSEDGKLFDKDKTELIRVPAGANDESYVVPETVEKIGSGAFSDCSAMTEVTMTEGVTEIGDGAFSGCENLTKINVKRPAPKMMLKAATKAGAQAEVFTLPDTVSKIGAEAFAGCSSITAIKLSARVEYIGDGAFANCVNLVSIEVDANNPNYCFVDGILYNKDMTKLICVPAGLTGNIELPECVTGILNGAFSGCTVELTLTIPTALSGNTFGACTVKIKGQEETHTYELRVVAPTCTAQGYTVLITDGVEGEHTNLTAKAAHKYGAWHTATAATCTANGTEERVCSVCGDTQTRDVTGGHEYSTRTVAPTCTEDGYTLHKCVHCDESYKTDTVTRLGHDIVSHAGKDATCTESGYEAYDTCSRCEYTTYKEIPATGHHFELGKCQLCGETDPNYNPGGSSSGGNFFSRLLDSIRNFFRSIFSWLPFC